MVVVWSTLSQVPSTTTALCLTSTRCSLPIASRSGGNSRPAAGVGAAACALLAAHTSDTAESAHAAKIISAALRTVSIHRHQSRTRATARLFTGCQTDGLAG